MDAAPSATPLLWLSFSIAFVFGAIAQKTHFCTMGAVSDILTMGDWSRMRMWLLAIGIAILGATALHWAGLIDLDKSIYRGPTLNWLSHLAGGFCFGIGMVLASGCGAKTLIRIGGGNLKSLVVLIILGLTAYMTMKGILGTFRVKVLDQASLTLPGGQDIPALLAGLGLAPTLALWLPAMTIGGGLMIFALRDQDFRTPDNLLGGIAGGLAIVAAWYVSGHLGYLPEDPETLQEAFIATNSGRMESLTFVAPLAYLLDLLMLWSDSSRKLTLGVASALGVIAGAALWAITTHRFRWEGFRDVADTARHLIGAALMGFGGVTALGCTVGQGISGMSTLALGSLLTLIAMIAGAALTLRLEYQRILCDK